MAGHKKTPHRVRGITPPRTTQPKVDVSYLSGKHSMKFGFSYNRYTKNQQLFGNPGGAYASITVTGGTILQRVTVTYSGDPFMDMVLGLAGSFSQAQALPVRHYVNQTTSFYAMDNWKVTPRLSLQLGLRYDALPHAWERSNNLSNFDPNAYLSEPGPKLYLHKFRLRWIQMGPASLR